MLTTYVLFNIFTLISNAMLTLFFVVNMFVLISKYISAHGAGSILVILILVIKLIIK